MHTSPSFLTVLNALSSVVRSKSAPDLTMRQLTLLMLLVQKPVYPAWSVLEAANTMGTNKPAVTRAVERLRELGLITVVQDKADRRRLVLNPTADGIYYLNAMMQGAQDPRNQE